MSVFRDPDQSDSAPTRTISRRPPSLARRCWIGFRRGLAEIWALLSLPLQSLRPREMRATVARGRQDLSASSHMIALDTKRTIGNVLWIALLSPVNLARWLWSAPRRFLYFLHTSSWTRICWLCGLTLVTIGGMAYGAWFYRHYQFVERVFKEKSRQLEDHFARGNLVGVKEDLAALIIVRPKEPKLAARLAALNSGAADPDDPVLARLLMGSHRVQGQLAEAHREAIKYVVHEPDDWLANTILAEYELRRDNPKAASEWVKKLPFTRDQSHDAPTLWNCSLASKVFRELGDEERLEDLIDLIVNKYLGFLRNSSVAKADADASLQVMQLQLIELFTLSLKQLPRRPELMSFWPDAQKVCQGIASSPSATTIVLVILGVNQEVQLDTHMREMRRLRLVSDEEYVRMAGELEARLKSIWDRVRQAEPKNSFGYIGSAMQLARAGKIAESIAVLDVGLQAAGTSPELVEKKAEMLRRSDPAAALKFLDESLSRTPNNPTLCRLMAQSALAAGQPGRVRQALLRGQELQPGAPWIVVLEAELKMKEGEPTGAASVLRKVLPLIPRDAEASGLYVKALAASGNLGQAEEFLNNLVDHQQGSQSAVMAGCEGLIAVGRVEIAINVLRRLIRRDPLSPLAVLPTIGLADCLIIQCEQRSEGWDRVRVEEALDLYRFAARRIPNNLYFANKIAWLELTAIDSIRVAQITAAPMLASASLPPDMQLTLGAIAASAGQFEPAKVALEKALAGNGKQALIHAYLALSYQGLKQPTLAEEHINKAIQLPTANARDAELVKEIHERIKRGITPVPQ